MGSAGAKIAAVIRGEAEIYVHAGGQYEWDSAAPVAVALAAGLHASRIDGSPLRYAQPDPWLPDLLVCHPELAAAVLDALRELGVSTVTSPWTAATVAVTRTRTRTGRLSSSASGWRRPEPGVRARLAGPDPPAQPGHQGGHLRGRGTEGGGDRRAHRLPPAGGGRGGGHDHGRLPGRLARGADRPALRGAGRAGARGAPAAHRRRP